ncbi:hypothetical protein CHISP_0723 [Chitinispirillum alkaliphilum]|nr:hypothetical protein CHISP_0723 [Chitinispirillum alkaliphilum]
MSREDKDIIRESFIGQEDGHIYFFYRPHLTEVRSAEDIENLYIVLHPLASKTLRLLSLDKPKLPLSGEHFNMITGEVVKVDDKPQGIVHELDERKKFVHGVPEQQNPKARACGEGIYTLIAKEKQIHLLYVLELPSGESQITTQLGIDNKGDFLFGVYNPYYGTDPEDPEPQVSPVYPEYLQKPMENQRITHTQIHRLLDYEQTRFALFREETEAGSGKILHPLKETAKSADIFSDLQLRVRDFPVKPLIEGKWL